MSARAAMRPSGEEPTVESNSAPMSAIAATVGAVVIPVDAVDAREALLRATAPTSTLPRPGTSEGRQLRRWLTQLLVTEQVVTLSAAALGVTAVDAPSEDDILPDITARLEIGSVAAAVLSLPLARAMYAQVTADVDISEREIADYHARNPLRFAVAAEAGHGWRSGCVPAPSLEAVRPAIAEHLRAAARRRAFRRWLDARCAELVELGAGYEHPGDPRQPDNTHKH